MVEFAASLNLQRRNLSQSQKAIAAQACLPLLEAEAKARKVLAGRLFGENHPQEVVPVLAQPLESTENPTMLPKNNIKSAKEAGRIMRVMIDRTERLERNSGSNSQRGQVSSALPTKVHRITGKISRHIYYFHFY